MLQRVLKGYYNGNNEYMHGKECVAMIYNEPGSTNVFVYYTTTGMADDYPYADTTKIRPTEMLKLDDRRQIDILFDCETKEKTRIEIETKQSEEMFKAVSGKPTPMIPMREIFGQDLEEITVKFK